ncbi:VOC family protein [Granulicella arctica]|uniref:VOC family protein n=1 Tax=Granulicella arctica TaxID=940613 RepID=UPI0021DF6DB9|nr:VOC family protein [Granulicella arctica]
MAQLKAVPDGYHSIQPYLIFKNTVEAIAFYTEAFGAKERLCMKNENGSVGHAEIEIGDCCIMMADESEKMEAFGTEHYGGSPINLMLYAEDCDAVYAKAIAAGAVSVREPADQPYGDRMSGVKDPFGYKWWIATNIKYMTRDELERLG